MLLIQELHEAGNKSFCLPGTRMPEWFEHYNNGHSISFWFRDKFPSISLCMVGLMRKITTSWTVCSGHWTPSLYVYGATAEVMGLASFKCMVGKAVCNGSIMEM
ncbi:hypothetical protein P8452_74576 [Trifolium repens]|nr:hypothetical protein P8452_74576 [Trifolium repens]